MPHVNHFRFEIAGVQYVADSEEGVIVSTETRALNDNIVSAVGRFVDEVKRQNPDMQLDQMATDYLEAAVHQATNEAIFKVSLLDRIRIAQ